MAAITIFIALPELLRCLAEVIRSRKQLAKLRLVCRHFHDAATPFLFRDCHIELSSTPPFHENSPHLRHVRRLSITPGWFSNTEVQNERIQQIVTRMPRLENFNCRSIPLLTETLRVLSNSCTKLKAVHVAFLVEMERSARWARVHPHEMGQPTVPVYPRRGNGEIPQLYRNPDVTMFQRLEELSLENLYHDLDWWKANVVRVLKNSPGLKKLHLSLSKDSFRQWVSQSLSEAYRDFFDSVCNQYGATSALPLRLESLICGSLVYPRNITSLKRLTELPYLEEVHITNRIEPGFGDEAHSAEAEPEGIVYYAFGPDHSPNLRRFTADICREDVWQFLSTTVRDNPSFARRLAISFQWQHSEKYELASFLRPKPTYPGLPVHFRMLDLELEREALDPDMMMDDENLPEGEEHYPTEKVLDDLVTNDAGVLEGLMVRLPENRWQEHGIDYLDFLEHALPKLVNLTQLAIAVGNFNDIRSMDITEGMLLGAAQRLAVAAPHLRYIKICCQHYRIWRNKDGTVTLDELEDREIGDVELFSHTTFLPTVW